MRPRSSVTARLACTACGCISKVSSTASPADQRRLIGRYFPGTTPAIGLPFTLTVFCFDHPGMRTNKVNSWGEAGVTARCTVPSHGYWVVCLIASLAPSSSCQSISELS